MEEILFTSECGSNPFATFPYVKQLLKLINLHTVIVQPDERKVFRLKDIGVSKHNPRYHPVQTSYNIWEKVMTESSFKHLCEAHNLFLNYIKNNPKLKFVDLKLSYNVKKIWKDDFEIMVNHRLIPLSNNIEKPINLLLIESISSELTEGNVTIWNRHLYQNYVWENNNWNIVATPKLSEMEIKVMMLCHMGYNTQEIAKKVCRSYDTVKDYRKSILQKLDVQTMIQAIAYAHNHGII